MNNTDSGGPGRFERYRAYLKALARLRMGRSLRQKADPSDVVQQVLLRACQTAHRPDGSGAEISWLGAVLTNELIDHHRRLSAEKRDWKVERSLNESVNPSSSHLNSDLASSQSSPSERVARGEDLVKLSLALETLPCEQRQAIELHHLQGLTVNEVAAAMSKTRAAVAGILRRGLKQLRAQL